MTTRPSLHRGGFTLVELLVVIAIIGVLVSLMLPAINGAREAGRKMGCSNNARGLGQAVMAYENANKAFPNGGYSVSVRTSNDPNFQLQTGFSSPANGYAAYAYILGSGPRCRNFSLGNPAFSGPAAQVGGPGYSIAPYLEYTNVYNKIAEAGSAYAQLDAFGCPSKGQVLETLPGYAPATAGTMFNGLDLVTNGDTTGLATVVAGAAGAISKINNAGGTVDSVKNQTGTTPGGWYLISQGMAPAFSISAFAFNQQLCPDRNSLSADTAATAVGSTNRAAANWASWPNCIGGGLGQGNGNNVNYPRQLKDLTDGASQTLLAGEINSDTRQYNTGNLVYRDHAFSGGGELTRALGGTATVNGVANVPTLYTQLVFPDQNFDVMGWSNVRGYWGGPHPGGATMVMADGSVVSVPHGTDVSSFVGMSDQIVNDSSKLGR